MVIMSRANYRPWLVSCRVVCLSQSQSKGSRTRRAYWEERASSEVLYAPLEAPKSGSRSSHPRIDSASPGIDYARTHLGKKTPTGMLYAFPVTRKDLPPVKRLGSARHTLGLVHKYYTEVTGPMNSGKQQAANIIDIKAVFTRGRTRLPPEPCTFGTFKIHQAPLKHRSQPNAVPQTR